MSEVRLLIRTNDGDWSGTVHGAFAERVVAALSADPTNLDELAVALERFQAPRDKPFGNLSPSSNDEPYDAGLVVVDLAARCIAAESTYAEVVPAAGVEYHDGRAATEHIVNYHLAKDWLILPSVENWRTAMDQRRAEMPSTSVDARPIFYGKPMLEHLAREAFAAFNRVAVSPSLEGKALADATKQCHAPVHASWLMTPRNDLGGKTPREFILEQHDHISSELNDRMIAWTVLNRCPRGLDESSHAYRFGGFGTHELVVYYDMIRKLLYSCFDRLCSLHRSPDEKHRPANLSVGDFLTDEVPRLESVRDAWLDSPEREFHGRTPRSVIERERKRLPEGMSAKESIIDPDCPCCQMAAELPGPAFWGLDSAHFDDDFAFDIYRTREEWEEEQRYRDEQSRKWDAERAEREALGVSYETEAQEPIWSRSFVAEGTDIPIGVRVFSVGCRLAEIIASLRAVPESQFRIDALNRAFGNLREVLQTEDASLAESLLDPVLSKFDATLEETAAEVASAESKCTSLRGELKHLLKPGKHRWTGDEDIPF